MRLQLSKYRYFTNPLHVSRNAMKLLRYTIIFFFVYASLSACRDEMNLAGNWEASKVVIWNSYHNASDTIDFPCPATNMVPQGILNV